ncbi:hypothetical protein CHGG_08774 [Chaetomium globosum CBS 148.51]|uniref:Uncharacterized protein n=1 Tax=Chaetomium globosum (strain ATCC 6205 / CBS 148.51 / DSM 1962 / NBRC 6347 / NRRL 1970) TaxID=306901 RepID=Q2GTD0_CHAGB|nr:uncharacterized protein CHGG_08774 [Chaetomium globosum CBS 148.51]EAQ84760.1 hypothetical protein CHGG_08774 [Chaetomium globosum CBS 148.51]
MTSPAAARAAQSPCRLVPPCKQGNHGFYIDANGERVNKTIGKYYFTEDALQQDLAALKRGEAYDKDDFFRRAKAWYKAEIDRNIHFETVQQEMFQPASNSAVSKHVVHKNETPASPNKDLDFVSRRTIETRSQTPTRIQPVRAAKRKATTLPPTKRPPRRNKKMESESGRAVRSTAIQPGLQSVNSHRPKTETETRGDYILAGYDWAQFLNGNQGEHHPSPWSCVQLQGLDVAYFCMRLERVVEAQISELLAEQSLGTDHEPRRKEPDKRPAAAAQDSSAGMKEAIPNPHGGKAKPQAPVAPPASIPDHTTTHPQIQIQTQTHPNPNPVHNHHHHPPPPPPPTPFSPAAALRPRAKTGEPPCTTINTIFTTPTSTHHPHPPLKPQTSASPSTSTTTTNLSSLR